MPGAAGDPHTNICLHHQLCSIWRQRLTLVPNPHNPHPCGICVRPPKNSRLLRDTLVRWPESARTSSATLRDLSPNSWIVVPGPRSAPHPASHLLPRAVKKGQTNAGFQLANLSSMRTRKIEKSSHSAKTTAGQRNRDVFTQRHSQLCFSARH